MRATGFAALGPRGKIDTLDLDLAPSPHEVVVAVAGCGLCHTDLGFFDGDVKPKLGFPLVLGHEISGKVVEAGEQYSTLLGRPVIVPAVMPCGECARCQAGYEATCERQVMPGNDRHGGFATHVCVPGRWLTPLPDDLGEFELAELSVVADAVSTPYQAVLRARVKPGDVAIVIGAGGIGTHGVQIAKAMGAFVVAIDINAKQLDRIKPFGADVVIPVDGRDPRAMKKAVQAAVADANQRDFAWKILEMSGSRGGQELAFNLLSPAGTLAVVGFTMEKLELRLSNLMALDATCCGNWGCSPAHYPAIVDLVLSKRIALKPFIEMHPLAKIEQLFEAAHAGALTRRAILVPSG